MKANLENKNMQDLSILNFESLLFDPILNAFWNPKLIGVIN